MTTIAPPPPEKTYHHQEEENGAVCRSQPWWAHNSTTAAAANSTNCASNPRLIIARIHYKAFPVQCIWNETNTFYNWENTVCNLEKYTSRPLHQLCFNPSSDYWPHTRSFLCHCKHWHRSREMISISYSSYNYCLHYRTSNLEIYHQSCGLNVV